MRGVIGGGLIVTATAWGMMGCSEAPEVEMSTQALNRPERGKETPSQKPSPSERLPIVVEANPVGENWLPGCAHRPSADPNSCRFAGSFADEVYAIRMIFHGLSPAVYGAQYFQVGMDSRDAMATADIEHRYFEVSISRTAGDLSGLGPSCRTPQNSAAASINVMDREQVSALDERQRAYAEATTCVLTAGEVYFVNVKPKNPGCKVGSTPPKENICRIRILNQVPNVD